MSYLFHREMLDRALVKRLRDSDSENEEESSSSSSNTEPKVASTDKPTDILTTVTTPEAQVCMTTDMSQNTILNKVISEISIAFGAKYF